MIFIFGAQIARAWSNGQPASLVLGQTDFTTNSDTGEPSATTTQDPNGVAVDPATGKVFVADSTNNCVLRFASIASLSNGVAAEAILGQSDFTNRDYSTITAAEMSGPTNVAVDSSGRLWVADTGNNRVLRFDKAATKANGAPADGVFGQADFTHNGLGTTQSTFKEPSGLVVDSSGRLWVSDSGNLRVLRFDNAAAKSNGANADGVLGQPDFTSSVSVATQNGMGEPIGITVDSQGHLWVDDTVNSRVLRFDSAATKTNGAAADGVLGKPDFTSTDNDTTQTGMVTPMGVAVDTTGTLWVADSNNNRVLRFDNAATKANGTAADGVLGQADFTSNAGAMTRTGLNRPEGIAVDKNNNIWIADNANSRVLYFTNNTP